VLEGTFHTRLTGVAHDAAVSVSGDGLRTVTLRGALLWTHFGASGPVVLNASRHWHRAKIEGREVQVRLSFLPALDFAGAFHAVGGEAGLDSKGAVVRTRGALR